MGLKKSVLLVNRLFGTWYGCFLKWWYPQNTPKWSFLVGIPWLLGTTTLGNPHILSRWNHFGFQSDFKYWWFSHPPTATPPMILMPMSTPLTSAEGTHLLRCGGAMRGLGWNYPDATGHPKGWSPKNDGWLKRRSIQSEFRNSIFVRGFLMGHVHWNRDVLSVFFECSFSINMIVVVRIYDPERTSYCLTLPIRELTERPEKPKVLQFDQPTAEKNLVKSRQNRNKRFYWKKRDAS